MKELPIPGLMQADNEMRALAERLAARIESLGGTVTGVRGMRLPESDHRRADVGFEYEGRHRQLSWDDIAREPEDHQLKEMMSSHD